MKEVQPIRDKDKIEQIKVLLKENPRDHLLFTVGINTGLRISDLLQLQVSDVQDKTHITIIESKTKKTKKHMINTQLKKDIDHYISSNNLTSNDYLFMSQKGNNKPISRVQAYRILNNVALKVGLDEIGTHTLRKTFGYFHYQQYKDVALLQELFNHSAPSVTLRYIGINQDIMDKSIEGFYL